MLTRRIRSMATVRARRHNGGDRTTPTRRESGGDRTAPVRRHHDNLFCTPTRTQGQRLSERTIANTVLTVSDLRQGPLTANGFLIHRNISFQFILARFTINSTAICINLFRLCTTAVGITLLLPLTLLILCSVLMFLSILTSLSLLLTLLFAVIHYYHN